MNNNLLNSLDSFSIKHFYNIAVSIYNIGGSKKSFLQFQDHGNSVVTEGLLSPICKLAL